MNPIIASIVCLTLLSTPLCVSAQTYAMDSAAPVNMEDTTPITDWQSIIEQHKPSDPVSKQCHYLEALQETEQLLKANRVAKTIWLTGKNLPNQCTPFLNAWLENNSQRDSLVEQRFKLAMSDKNYKLANYLTTLMPESKQAAIQAQLIVADHVTGTFLKRWASNSKVATHVMTLLQRLADKNPQLAAIRYYQLSQSFHFNKDQQQKFMRIIALAYATRYHKNALFWYKKLVGQILEPIHQTWLIRTALQHNDWQTIKAMVESHHDITIMPIQTQYWYARALSKLNNSKKANEIYNRLAKDKDFYGLLATYQLALPVQLNGDALHIDTQNIDSITESREIQKAQENFINKEPGKAQDSLFEFFKKSNTQARLLILSLIRQWGWISQSVRLSHYLKDHNTLAFQYPLSHKEVIHRHATEKNLDPALIYAIILQESRFDEKAVSTAGAIGIMQIMPTTAKYFADKHNIAFNDPEELYIVNTNIRFGTTYLNFLHQELEGNIILMSAAYNAGRKTVLTWLPQNKSIDADIWIETIPYFETRKYVKKVIVNHLHYQHRLGQSHNLKNLLKPISS